MGLRILGLFLRAAGTTFIPWLIPFLYAAIAGLTMHGIEPFHLSVVLIAGAIFGTIVLWFLDIYLEDRVNKRFPNTKNENKKGWLGKMTARVKQKCLIIDNRFSMFILTSFMTWSAIPDIVVIRLVRKKIGFFLFVVATIIGKAFVYTPIIYGAQLIHVLIAKFL